MQESEYENRFDREIGGLIAGGIWERADAERLSLPDLEELKAEVDFLCEVLATRLDIAKTSGKEPEDPTWIARLGGKWRHMKRKRIILQDLIAAERGARKHAEKLKRIAAAAKERNDFLESFYSHARQTLPEGVIKKLISLANQNEV